MNPDAAPRGRAWPASPAVRRAVSGLLFVTTLAGVVGTGEVRVADASSVVSGPSVIAAPSSAAPGETVTLTVDGFDGRTVTASICGNEARRGSGDCDMTGSVGVVLDPSGAPTIAVIPVSEPPAPCPCVVRVATASFDQIAVVPLVVVGHDVADPEDSDQQSAELVTSISARRVTPSLSDRVRAGLGGAVDYEVTVTVKNSSTVPVDDVVVTGSFGRSSTDFLGELLLNAPTQFAVGQTWQQVLRVTVPAHVFGSVAWRLEAVAGTSRSRADATTEQRPTLLVLLALVLVADLGLVAIRWRIRRRARRAPVIGMGSVVDASAA